VQAAHDRAESIPRQYGIRSKSFKLVAVALATLPSTVTRMAEGVVVSTMPGVTVIA